ncbi:Hpt domain-containing protein [bacterium]|nr:Hpt domain-containing protein [bacterium]
MNPIPIEVWEELWAGLEGRLQAPLDLDELAWLARQGRWACEFSRRNGGPQVFDLREWAGDLARRHGLQLSVRSGLAGLRWGDLFALEYLLLSLCWRAFGVRVPALCLEGNEAEIWVTAAAEPGDAWLAGPFLSYLLGLVRGSTGGAELFRCPCPAQEPEMMGTPVDLEALHRSCMDDEEFEQELIETFTAEGRRQLASLSINFSSHTLHSLKGSAAMVGATRLASMLGEQEKALDKDQLPELEAEFNRVLAFLQLRLK